MNNYLAGIIEHLPDATFIVDKTGKISHWNKAIQKLTKTEKGAMIGQDYKLYSKAIYGFEKPLLINYLLEGIKLDNAHYKNLVRRKDYLKAEATIVINKQTRMFEAIAALIRDKENAILGGIETFRDITEQKVHERKITYLSQHDSLTNLLNRMYFDKVKNTYNDKQFYPLSIIMADLNNLKQFNDHYGHQVGDRVLIRFAGLLQGFEQAPDILVRLGGDEFVLLMPNTAKNEAKNRLASIKKALEDAKVEGIKIEAALGLAVAKEPINIERLMKQAEDEMYLDKAKYQKEKDR